MHTQRAPSHTVSVAVSLHSSSFTPSSTVSATITLSTHPPPTSHSDVSILAPTRAPLSTSTSTFPPRLSHTLADYVVAELSGRYSLDPSFLTPHAHDHNPPDALDCHTQPPFCTRTTTFSKPYPWHAALSDANGIGGGGRFGYSGIIFRSPPLIVCEKEHIPNGVGVSFDISCVLPDQVPPTFRGGAARYFYSLIVVVQTAGDATPYIVRVPIRIVTPGGASNHIHATQLIDVPARTGVGPRGDPFLQTPKQPLHMTSQVRKCAPPEDIEIALALSLNGRLTPYRADDERANADMSTLHDAFNLSAKRKVLVYQITHDRRQICKVFVASGAYTLGGSVRVSLMFPGGGHCIRVDAKLEACERIGGEYCAGKGTDGNDAVVFKKVYGEHGEFVMCKRNTDVVFSIPYHATGSFCTNVVNVSWVLHFVFLISKAEVEVSESEDEQFAPIVDGDEDDEGRRLLDVPAQVVADASESKIVDDANWHGWLDERGGGRVDVLRWTLPIVVSGRVDAYTHSASFT